MLLRKMFNRNILRSKMFRDMKLYKVQFISIFLMSLLGVFVFAGINGEWYGMQKEIDKYYADTRLPDFWVVGDNFSGQDITAAEKIPLIPRPQPSFNNCGDERQDSDLFFLSPF